MDLRNNYENFNLLIFFSVQVNVVPGPQTIKDGGLPGVYIFDQMHFHWASEHTIDGNR